MKKKLAIPIVVSIFILAFVTISVSVYLISTAANRNGNEIRFYGCTKYQVTQMIHCDPLTNKLVGYLFPGNQSLIYTSAGTPMFVGGKHGLGLGLAANRREAVEFANTSRLDPNKFSLSFWLKDAKHPEPYGTVISHYNRNSSAGWSLDTYSNGTSLGQLIRLSVFSEGGHRFTSSPASISTTTFAHVVVTFNGSSIKIYENGILLGITGFNGKYISDPGLPMMIGSSSYCLTCNMWSGIIDQFRFYNRAINESEVKEIFFDDSPSTVSDGLVGYWTFENSLNDISGKNKGNLDSMITSMAFTPDGRLFFDEKNTGKIRIMKHDRVLSTPFAVLSDYYANWEQGLLGLTIDPKFEQNHFVYLYYTAIDNKTGQAQIFNRLVRFTENNNQAANMIVLIDKIPASRGYHSGGALTFGPDDKLYIGIGDATQHIFAQDGEIFTGKVLRINRDGTIPQDNPFPNSSVYTLGHRNIFGLAFDKKDGIGIITENGDFHYDEINLIQKGGNYGFPSLQPPNIAPELFTNNSSIKPLRSYWQTIAPTQAIYYGGDKLPQLKNKFLFGTFTGNIYALTVDKSSKVIEEEKIALRHYPFEPVVSIAQSPSGDIYFGGYHIYKLQSVDMSRKTQDLFPIEIKSLSNVAIKDLQSSNNDSGIAVNIHISTNKNGSSSSTRPFLQMNIPSALVPEISSVTTSVINGEKQLSTKPVDSTTTSSPSYNTIGIHFQPEIDYSQLLINGISPKHNIQNATSIQSNPSDISSVSIVKYATDTSTAMPYNPSPMTVKKGTVVTWTNNDFETHTVTEVTNKFDSGILAPAQVFKHTFDELGIVKYYCTLHPFMSGEVIVKSISDNNSLSPIIIHHGNNSNKRIAFVENTFTYAAYRNGSFYDFYKKYIPITEEPSIVFNITSDLNLLKNRPIPHGPFPYYAHPREPPDIPYIEYFKILLKHVKKNDPLVTNITDVDVHEGKIFRTNGSNAYDILFLFHNEYATQTEYNNLRQFVSNGGTIVFTEANTLFAEVSYNKANDTITLVKGHEWKFDGKSARRSIGERWLAENKEWTGSNFLDIPSTYKISYKNNPFNYTNGEEQYVTNPHAKILLDYRASFSSDKYPNATVATYQMDYGKGKIINLGIWGHELINNEAFLNYFDNVIMPIAVGSTDKNIITK